MISQGCDGCARQSHALGVTEGFRSGNKFTAQTARFTLWMKQASHNAERKRLVFRVFWLVFVVGFGCKNGDPLPVGAFVIGALFICCSLNRAVNWWFSLGMAVVFGGFLRKIQV